MNVTYNALTSAIEIVKRDSWIKNNTYESNFSDSIGLSSEKNQSQSIEKIIDLKNRKFLTNDLSSFWRCDNINANNIDTKRIFLKNRNTMLNNIYQDSFIIEDFFNYDNEYIAKPTIEKDLSTLTKIDINVTLNSMSTKLDRNNLIDIFKKTIEKCINDNIKTGNMSLESIFATDLDGTKSKIDFIEDFTIDIKGDSNNYNTIQLFNNRGNLHLTAPFNSITVLDLTNDPEELSDIYQKYYYGTYLENKEYYTDEDNIFYYDRNTNIACYDRYPNMDLFYCTDEQNNILTVLYAYLRDNYYDRIILSNNIEIFNHSKYAYINYYPIVIDSETSEIFEFNDSNVVKKQLVPSTSKLYFNEEHQTIIAYLDFNSYYMMFSIIDDSFGNKSIRIEHSNIHKDSTYYDHGTTIEYNSSDDSFNFSTDGNVSYRLIPTNNYLLYNIENENSSFVFYDENSQLFYFTELNNYMTYTLSSYNYFYNIGDTCLMYYNSMFKDINSNKTFLKDAERNCLQHIPEFIKPLDAYKAKFKLFLDNVKINDFEYNKAHSSIKNTTSIATRNYLSLISIDEYSLNKWYNLNNIKNAFTVSCEFLIKSNDFYYLNDLFFDNVPYCDEQSVAYETNYWSISQNEYSTVNYLYWVPQYDNLNVPNSLLNSILFINKEIFKEQYPTCSNKAIVFKLTNSKEEIATLGDIKLDNVKKKANALSSSFNYISNLYISITNGDVLDSNDKIKEKILEILTK